MFKNAWLGAPMKPTLGVPKWPLPALLRERRSGLRSWGNEAPQRALALGAMGTRVTGTELFWGFISPDKHKDTQPQAQSQS